MAAWKDEDDMTRDLDTLSGFKSPSGRVKSYTTWGRGQQIDEPEISSFPLDEKQTPQEEFVWFKESISRKIPESVSRGKMLEILIEKRSRKGKESEIREQIRDAIGSGYSNEIIEATFKPRMECNASKSEDAGNTDVIKNQFEDAEASHLLQSAGCELSEVSGAIPHNSNKNIDSQKCGKPKKKRRFRNIAMESLERKNLESNSSQGNGFLDSNINIGELSRVLQNNSGKENNGRSPCNIPPACYVPYKRGAPSFVYSEKEFPKL